MPSSYFQTVIQVMYCKEQIKFHIYIYIVYNKCAYWNGVIKNVNISYIHKLPGIKYVKGIFIVPAAHMLKTYKS